jgi:hypothetical protein
MNPIHHATKTVYRKAKHLIIVTSADLITHYCVQMLRSLVVGMIKTTLLESDCGMILIFFNFNAKIQNYFFSLLQRRVAQSATLLCWGGSKRSRP